LKSSYHLYLKNQGHKAIWVCGYASNPNQPSIPPALFAAYVLVPGFHSPARASNPNPDAYATSTLTIDESNGQDPHRTWVVRNLCDFVNISI